MVASSRTRVRGRPDSARQVSCARANPAYAPRHRIFTRQLAPCPSTIHIRSIPSLGVRLEHTINNATLPARRSHDRNRHQGTFHSPHRALARLFHGVDDAASRRAAPGRVAALSHPPAASRPPFIAEDSYSKMPSYNSLHPSLLSSTTQLLSWLERRPTGGPEFDSHRNTRHTFHSAGRRPPSLLGE